MILYPDQEVVLEAVRQELRTIKPNGRKPRVVLQSPCGFGKSAVAAFIAKGVAERGGSSWFICNRDFLLEQTSKTYNNVGLPHSYLAAGRKLDASLPTQIGMIGSLRTRRNKVKAPVVAVWDECNSIAAKTWAEQLDAMPDTIHIGLTATPCRSDNIGLDQYFDGMVIGPSVSELIAKNRLSDYIYYRPSKPDLSNVHVRMGEYVTAELDVEMSKAKIVGNIVGSYQKYANDSRAVYFATSVETSKRYAAAFTDAGINAVHLDANSSPEERKEAAVSMAMGRLKVISNVGLFGYGLDLAAIAEMPVTIETVGLCRPTKSFPLLVQMMMRCMRAKEYPGIILDHAGSYDEFDFLPDDEITWSLSGAKRTELIGTYQCVGCGACLKRGASVCAFCGTDASARIAEIKARKEAEHIAGELTKVERERRIIEAEAEKKEAVRKRNAAINMCKSYSDFVNVGKKYGYSKGWAGVQYKLRFKKG